jgi:cytochrome d ubiquinol oxidase subunit II
LLKKLIFLLIFFLDIVIHVWRRRGRHQGIRVLDHRAQHVLPRLLTLSAADGEALCWLPFAATVGIFLLAFNGLAYSVFPYLVADKLTIWQAASAPESLKIILYGVAIVLPTIIGYTVFSYRVFWGKARELSYQ